VSIKEQSTCKGRAGYGPKSNGPFLGPAVEVCSHRRAFYSIAHDFASLNERNKLHQEPGNSPDKGTAQSPEGVPVIPLLYPGLCPGRLPGANTDIGSGKSPVLRLKYTVLRQQLPPYCCSVYRLFVARVSYVIPYRFVCVLLG
jgi:hypothetical protein